MKYYTHFHKDQKRQEFFKLKQFGRSVIEYEIELRKIVEFVPDLANSEEHLCSKFEEGLSLKIREKMSITRSQSYKEVVQLALRTEKLTSERCLEVIFKKEKFQLYVWSIIEEKQKL